MTDLAGAICDLIDAKKEYDNAKEEGKDCMEFGYFYRDVISNYHEARDRVNEIFNKSGDKNG
jgi:hypothetical protein